MFPRQEPARERGLTSGVGWQMGTLQVEAVRTRSASVVAMAGEENTFDAADVRAMGRGRSIDDTGDV